MSDSKPSTGTPRPPPGRRLAAIVFADVAGYTELSSRDEDQALQIIEEFQGICRLVMGAHQGRVVKFLGDGMLAEFHSLDSAVAASHELQRMFSNVVGSLGWEVALRVGVHLGDVVFSEDGDVYGSGVNVASRIEGHAPLSGVVVSDSAYRQLRNRRAYRFNSIGEHELKGVPDPMELYVVLLEDQAAPQPAVKVLQSKGEPVDSPFWRFARWAFAFVIVAGLAAYAADVRGVRDSVVRVASMIGLNDVLSRTTVERPRFQAVEGGAVVTGPITLAFTGPVDPTTATSESVQLLGPNGQQVPVEIVVQADARSLDIVPLERLGYESLYRVVLTALLRSAAGTGVDLPESDLPPDQILAFRTQGIPAGAPRLVEADPADGADAVRPGASFVLSFDAALDSASALGAVVLRDVTGTEIGVEIACCGEDGQSLTVRPAEALAEGGHELLVSPELLSTEGDAAEGAALTFTVAAPAAVAPPPTGPARLAIEVVPTRFAEYAVVFMDGQRLGASPVASRTVQEGVSHSIEIYASSPVNPDRRLLIYDADRQFRPGSSQTLRAEVTAYGFINIVTNPAGTAYIDGQPVGETPLQRHPVPAGRTLTLEVRPSVEASGAYRPYTVSFTVEALAVENLGRVDLPGR